MERFVILSGCSGGGKSSLLAELARRGHAVIEEPGRRIVAEETQRGGRALPWIDLAAFAARAVDLSRHDRERALGLPGMVFFDRGLIDAAAALEFADSRPALENCRAERFNRLVFLTPPWPEIYITDDDRRHGMREAVAEYERLLAAYAALDYETVILPKISIGDRADLVTRRLGLI